MLALYFDVAKAGGVFTAFINAQRDSVALSAKKGELLSPLAFGETGVKERVKNVLHYKKPAFWVSVVAALVVAAVSLSLVVSKHLEAKPENLSNQGAELNSISESLSGIPEGAYHTEYNRVKIEFLSDMMGFKSENDFDSLPASSTTASS